MSTLSIPHRYVVGFAFSADMSRVLLIRKNRPLWMAGKLNGIGGRAEHGEGLVEAMIREATEEAGLTHPDWRQVGRIVNAQVSVAVFAMVCAYGPEASNSPTDEMLLVCRVDEIDPTACVDPVANIVQELSGARSGNGFGPWRIWDAPQIAPNGMRA